MPLMVVDPRISPPSQEKVLAPRPESLSGRTIMLFDNGKLGPAYGPYGVLFEPPRSRWPRTSSRPSYR